MPADPTEPTAPAPSASAPLPSKLMQYLENVASAFRTAGAALIGNAALIYFGFVGAHSEMFWKAMVMGVLFVLIGCVPVLLFERDRQPKTPKPAPEDNSAKAP